MADEYTFQQSLVDQSDDFIFQNRQYTFITDSNSSSYQTQIVLDMAGIANSGKYFDATQSFIEIPTVTTLYALEGNLNNVTGENAYAVSMKNGYSSLISSIQIECTNNSVVSTMNFSNLAINHTLLTTMSLDDESNYGDSINFKKDTASSISYQSSSSATGLGDSNVIIKPTLFDPASGYGNTSFNQNKGRLERMKCTSYDPLITGESLGNLAVSGKSYCQRDTLGLNGKVVNWYGLAHIPLHILSDFFNKFPLCKGAYLRLTLNLNVNCSSVVTIADNKFSSVVSSSQSGCVPFLLSPIDGGLNISGTTTATKVEVSIGVARNSINSSGSIFSHPTMSSCRIYCCLYDFTPQAEQMYLSKNPTKKIKYTDFLSFQVLNVPAGGNFSQILTNSIARGRQLIAIPQISSSFNFAGDGRTIAPLNSPFSTSTCTTSKNAITNYNVLVSGSNLYQQNLSATFDFYQELR